MGVQDATRPLPGRTSGPSFRAFQAGRPDHERWELIDGAPMMMTPPTIAHSRIAGNLERLLNDALALQDRIEARVDVRTQAGWRSETLVGPQTELVLPSFGLCCRVAELYEGTPLQPRGVSAAGR